MNLRMHNDDCIYYKSTSDGAKKEYLICFCTWGRSSQTRSRGTRSLHLGQHFVTCRLWEKKTSQQCHDRNRYWRHLWWCLSNKMYYMYFKYWYASCTYSCHILSIWFFWSCHWHTKYRSSTYTLRQKSFFLYTTRWSYLIFVSFGAPPHYLGL